MSNFDFFDNSRVMTYQDVIPTPYPSSFLFGTNCVGNSEKLSKEMIFVKKTVFFLIWVENLHLESFCLRF